MSSSLKLKPSLLKVELKRILEAKLVPMVRSSPGQGKSSIMRQVAKELNLKMIDIRLSQCDPTDLLGFPQIVNGKASYVPMDTFPLDSDPLPLNGEESIDPTDPNKKIQHTYDGWLIHFDELPSAPQALQAASYKIMLEREVGSHKLHPNVYIAASGNNESDNAVTFEMSTALQSRLIHLDLEPNVDDFVANARLHKFDSRVIAFIQYRPLLLDNFKPDHADKTFACSRTWEFTSSLIKNLPYLDFDILPTLAGTLGSGVAQEFHSFTQIYRDLPTIADILANPQITKIPQEPSAQFAVSNLIYDNLDTNTAPQLMIYLDRLPIEFQILVMTDFFTANPTQAGNAAFVPWLTKNAQRLTTP